MSKIPRNKRIIGEKHKKKFGEKNAIKNEKVVFDSICEKHGIRELYSCRSATLIEPNGQITLINYKQTIGNMKASILVFQEAKLEISNSEIVYDLIRIEQEKKKKDQEKAMEDMKKTKEHMESLKRGDQSNLKENIEAMSSEKASHDTIMNMLEQDTASEEKEKEKEKEIQIEKDLVSPDSTDSTIQPEQIDNTAIAKEISRMPDKSNPIPKVVGNKHNKKFLMEIYNKYTMELQSQYKYVEVKIGATCLVIDTANIYKINLPHTKEYCLLIAGDLQMKSGLIKQIDPNYGAEEVIEEQAKFADKIQEKEKLSRNKNRQNIESESIPDFIKQNAGIIESPDSDSDSIPDLEPINQTNHHQIKSFESL